MKILLIQMRRVGDILLTTPVATYLKQIFPEVMIDFLCEPPGKSVLEGYPDLNEVLVFDKSRRLEIFRRVRDKHYDAVLDFINIPTSSYLAFLSGAKWKVGFKKSIRSFLYNLRVPYPQHGTYVPEQKLHLVREWLQVMGMKPPVPLQITPKIFLNDGEMQFARKWVESENMSKEGFIVLVPIPRYPIRQWRSEGFVEVGSHLQKEFGLKVYLAWGPGEENSINEVQHKSRFSFLKLPPTTFRQMAAIFSKARLVVTNESGAMHLAVSVGTPTVTIYGPTKPQDWNPSFSSQGSRFHQAVTADGVKCLGCNLGQCPVGHICMNNLDSEKVLKVCRTLLT